MTCRCRPGGCTCAGSEFAQEAQARMLKIRIRLLSRLLCEYMADHGDRTEEALNGAPNAGCVCVLCDRAREALK